MARQIGVVTEVKENSAMVKTQHAPACQGCSQQGACHLMGGGKEIEVEALNPVHAKAGDTVTLEYGSGRRLGLSLLIYIFPVFALVIGAVLGNYSAPALGADPSMLAAVIGFIGLLLALGLLLAMEKKAKQSDKYKPTIVRAKRSPLAGTEKCELCH
ncbi:MAG: SoxR reducing system RseC family protein [Desulfobacteraceae bacterium]|nr:SoxR reducing system RseC family protein [Desulfobacteraceae bacterium]